MSHVCHLVAIETWGNYLSSPFVYKMEISITALPLSHRGNDQCKHALKTIDLISVLYAPFNTLRA